MPPREPLPSGWLLFLLCGFVLSLWLMAASVRHSILTGGPAVRGNVTYDSIPCPWVVRSTRHRNQ